MSMQRSLISRVACFSPIPQALFGKDPLKWFSRLAPALLLMRWLTYPVSRPLQILLDKLFPHQRAKLQSRQELGLLITEHLSDKTSELDDDEVEIHWRAWHPRTVHSLASASSASRSLALSSP